MFSNSAYKNDAPIKMPIAIHLNRFKYSPMCSEFRQLMYALLSHFQSNSVQCGYDELLENDVLFIVQFVLFLIEHVSKWLHRCDARNHHAICEKIHEILKTDNDLWISYTVHTTHNVFYAANGWSNQWWMVNKPDKSMSSYDSAIWTIFCSSFFRSILKSMHQLRNIVRDDIVQNVPVV